MSINQATNQFFREEDFLRNLIPLVRQNTWCKYFVVEKSGKIQQTHIFRILYEKGLGLIGFRDGANQRLIEYKTLEFLLKGREWIKSPKCSSLILALAERSGLIAAVKNHSPWERKLIRDISDVLVSKTENVFESKDGESVEHLLFRFYTYYKNELSIFRKELNLPVEQTASKIPYIVNQALNPPNVVLTEDQFSQEKKQECEIETHGEEKPDEDMLRDQSALQSEFQEEPSSVLVKDSIQKRPSPVPNLCSMKGRINPFSKVTWKTKSFVAIGVIISLAAYFYGEDQLRRSYVENLQCFANEAPKVQCFPNEAPIVQCPIVVKSDINLIRETCIQQPICISQQDDFTLSIIRAATFSIGAGLLYNAYRLVSWYRKKDEGILLGYGEDGGTLQRSPGMKGKKDLEDQFTKYSRYNSLKFKKKKEGLTADEEREYETLGNQGK